MFFFVSRSIHGCFVGLFMVCLTGHVWIVIAGVLYGFDERVDCSKLIVTPVGNYFYDYCFWETIDDYFHPDVLKRYRELVVIVCRLVFSF